MKQTRAARSSAPAPPPGPVTSRQCAAWSHALALADGDTSRVHVVSENTALVLNNPGQMPPAPPAPPARTRRRAGAR